MLVVGFDSVIRWLDDSVYCVCIMYDVTVLSIVERVPTNESIYCYVTVDIVCRCGLCILEFLIYVLEQFDDVTADEEIELMSTTEMK